MERESMYGALVVLAFVCVWLFLNIRKLNRQVGELTSEIDEQASRILDLEIERDFGGENGERIKAIKEERIRERRETAEIRASENSD